MKKIIKSLLAIVLVVVVLMPCMTACSPYPYNTHIFFDEYFEYHVLIPKKVFGYGKTECYVVGLTEKGLEQTHLVVPEYYGEYKINGIGYMAHSYLWSSGEIDRFGSENLEKLYINYNVNDWISRRGYFLGNTYVVFWTLDSGHGLLSIKGEILGYDYYLYFFDAQPSAYISKPIKIANVTYMYNYDGAENNGCYWVDSYEESVITFIPPEPQRNGYTFGGWYKEAECINEWNFETDITGKEIVMEKYKLYETYEGIYLYAKWEKE